MDQIKQLKKSGLLRKRALARMGEMKKKWVAENQPGPSTSMEVQGKRFSSSFTHVKLGIKFIFNSCFKKKPYLAVCNSEYTKCVYFLCILMHALGR